MSQSTNNQTNVPLRAGAIFLGTWDNVLNYNSAFYNIEASTACQISVYQSNNKIDYSVSTYNYTSGYVTNEIFLEQRYIYVTVRNSSGSDQTSMMFNMIYKNNGLVSVENFPRGTATLWTANVTSNNNTSASINLSAVPYTQISIYGTSSVAATLTVQMSNDGVTYYKSQYNSVLATGANFGFTVQSSAYYVRLVATGIATTATITAIANYS